MGPVNRQEARWARTASAGLFWTGTTTFHWRDGQVGEEAREREESCSDAVLGWGRECPSHPGPGFSPQEDPKEESCRSPSTSTGPTFWVPTDPGPSSYCLVRFIPPPDLGMSLCQEDARTDAVDSVVRDIQNTQCLLNVEHLSASCPHVTLQFADSKGDVGLGLVKEGLVMVEVRKEKQFQKVVRGVWCRPPPLPTMNEEGSQGPIILLLLLGKDNGLGLLFKKKKRNTNKKLITSQMNWLQVWLRMQLETRAESFPVPVPPRDRLKERVSAWLLALPALIPC